MPTKFNLFYRNENFLTWTWELGLGFKEALERNGLLNHSVNVSSSYIIDRSKLGDFPNIMLYGYEPQFDLARLELSGRTNILFEGEKLIEGEKSVRNDNTNYWTKVYTMNESDTPFYGETPSELVIGFIDTTMFKPLQEPEFEDILFCGRPYNDFRKDMVEKSGGKVVNILTKDMGDCRMNTMEFVKEINRHRYYVAPPSSAETFTGKPFQGMSCKRLTFIYKSPYTKKAQDIVKDGMYAVYFSTLEQLLELKDYFDKNQIKRDVIASSGCNLVNELFSIDKFVLKLSEDFS